MNWMLLVVTLLGLSPFLLLWLVAFFFIWKESGWRAALLLSLIVLPIISVMGLIFYGFGLLPDKSRSVIMGTVYGVSSAVTYYFIFVYLSGILQGQDILVDSKPPNFIEVSGTKFNAITLMFGLFMLIQSGTELGRDLKDNSWVLVEQLRFLFTLSIAGAFILWAFRRFQIRRNGIMTNSGRLLRWTSIVKYDWVKYQDRVRLEVRRRPFRDRTIMLVVPSEYRSVVDEYLLQYVGRAG